MSGKLIYTTSFACMILYHLYLSCLPHQFDFFSQNTEHAEPADSNVPWTSLSLAIFLCLFVRCFFYSISTSTRLSRIMFLFSSGSLMSFISTPVEEPSSSPSSSLSPTIVFLYILAVVCTAATMPFF